MPIYESGNPEWETFGGIDWREVDGNLELVPALKPRRGYASGEIPDNDGDKLDFWPWPSRFVKRLYIADGLFATGSLAYMFCGFASLDEIIFPKVFDTRDATMMRNMFSSCKNATLIQLSKGFDTYNTRNMGWMFSACESLENLVVPASFDVSRWSDLSTTFTHCDNLKGITTLESDGLAPDLDLMIQIADKDGFKYSNLHFLDRCTQTLSDDCPYAADVESMLRDVALNTNTTTEQHSVLASLVKERWEPSSIQGFGSNSYLEAVWEDIPLEDIFV